MKECLYIRISGTKMNRRGLKTKSGWLFCVFFLLLCSVSVAVQVEDTLDSVPQREEMALAQSDSVVSSNPVIDVSLPTRHRVVEIMQSNLQIDDSATSFFHYSAWSNRIFLIICSLLYFYWMFRLGRRSEEGDEKLRLHQNEPLWIPLLKCVIFFLVLLPLTSFSVPVIVLQGSYFLIFLLLFIILYPEFSSFKRKVLGTIFIYYILLILANLLQSDSWWSKIFSITTNLLGIILVWRMGKRTDVDNPIAYIPPYARWSIMAGFLLASMLNIVGYVQPARMWSLVSGIGLLQAMALRAFKDMLIHDLKNQYERANPNAMFRRLDLTRMLQSVDRLIWLICGALIAIVLLNNLHLMEETREVLRRILTRNNSIGGITYNYADLLLAIAVIWVSNWLQKNLKNLIDEPSSNELQRRKMTLFPLFRLLIMVIGFLFAVSVLNIGVDRLTVIIGALSVGVGLGLQNIINNFVSGIILVFEKPFKAGDYIELGDKKGQVLQIGIRASVLLMDEGARVIIPNGDLLSGRLVNWTFTENDIRLNMRLKIGPGATPIEDIKTSLRSTLRSFDHVDPSIPIKVFTKEISVDLFQLSIQVGIRHIRYIEPFRSKFLEDFKKEMDAREVTVTSI